MILREHRRKMLEERLLVGPAERGRVVETSDADDGALTRHQPRYRLDGADGSRVGEGDGGTGEVVG